MDKPTKLPPTERSDCGTRKGAAKHRYHKEQLCNPCRIAFNAYMADYHRDYNKRNPSKVAKWKSQRNPEKVKQWNATGKANYIAKIGAEKMREYYRLYKINNPDVAKKASTKWRASEAGKEASRNTARKRRAQKRATAHKPYTEQQVLNLWGTNCHICGKPIDFEAPRSQAKGLLGWERGLHFDHVVPLSKGGPDTLENVKPAHGKCNLKKSDN